MTRSPFEISQDALVQDVAALFDAERIPSVFVTHEGVPVGVIHIHMLLGTGLV